MSGASIVLAALAAFVLLGPVVMVAVLATGISARRSEAERLSGGQRPAATGSSPSGA